MPRPRPKTHCWQATRQVQGLSAHQRLDLATPARAEAYNHVSPGAAEATGDSPQERPRRTEFDLLNQRLDVADVRLRPTGGTGEVPIDVGDGITAFRPIAVSSKGARKIQLRFDASGFLAHLAKEGRGEDDERCTAAWAVAGYGCVLHHGYGSRVTATQGYF